MCELGEGGGGLSGRRWQQFCYAFSVSVCVWSISVWVNAKKNKMAIRVISNKKVCLSVANCNCQRVSACLRPPPPCENGQKSHLLKDHISPN